MNQHFCPTNQQWV